MSVRRGSQLDFSAVILFDADGDTPKYRQLSEQLRRAIGSGSLRADERLPSTRDLAKSLDVSRLTVQHAFEQLISEGVLVGRPGAGTFVTRNGVRRRPDDLVAPGRSLEQDLVDDAFSHRSAQSVEVGQNSIAFMAQHGGFITEEFGQPPWARLATRFWRERASGQSRESDAAGHLPLREELARHLSSTQGLYCDADQIVIVNSVQQAYSIVALGLMEAGDSVWVEDPGRSIARQTLKAMGAKIIPIQADDEGMEIAPIKGLQKAPKLIVHNVTGQFPFKSPLSVARRIELLEYADKHGAWILEDGQDQEPAALTSGHSSFFGAERFERAVHIGSFSAHSFAGVDLAYIILPRALVHRFSELKFVLNGVTPTAPQAILSTFLRGGEFARYGQMVKRILHERRSLLEDSLKRDCCLRQEVGLENSGAYLKVLLQDGGCDKQTAKSIRSRGVMVTAISDFAVNAAMPAGLLFDVRASSRAHLSRAGRTLNSISMV